MARVAGIAWQVLAVAAIVAYQVVVHLGVARGSADALGSVLLFAPVAAIGCWILLRSRHRLLWLGIVAAATGISLGLGRTANALHGIPHAAAYLFMLWLFGRTLLRGREPFITRLARNSRGGVLPAAMERYTRNLTLAWCVFFGLQLALSAFLLKFVSVEAWSLFVHVLNLPLVGAMFAADYVYRSVRYRDSRSSITNAIQAYAKDRASSLPR